MQIDRSRFLLLTASLAALACDQGPSTTPDTGGIEPASATSGSSATGESNATNESSATNGSASGGSNNLAQPTVWLEIEPGSEDPEAVPKGDCDNSIGRPGECRLVAPSSHCESFAATETFCEALPKFLKARPAEAVTDCLLAANATERICSWEIWQQCMGAGLQATCVDFGTRNKCQSLSSSCGGSIDVFVCQQSLSALEPSHTTHLANCVQEICDLPSCMVDMQYYN